MGFRMNDTTSKNSIFIGRGVTFQGSIKAPNQARIDGQIQGELEAQDVFIGPTGSVSGNTTANLVDVHGQINQSVVSRELLIIRSTGKVTGSLQYGDIQIERGGQFLGDMNLV
jgi:cytoskeletal protein CcmA (bactofilin family)